MPAGFDGAAVVVGRCALHGDEGAARGDTQEPGLPRVRCGGADALARDPQIDAGPAQESVQPFTSRSAGVMQGMVPAIQFSIRESGSPPTERSLMTW